jgi:plastocyanin
MIQSAKINPRIAAGVFFSGAILIAAGYFLANSKTPSGNTGSTGSPQAIRITDDGFVPETLRVKRGTVVRFINETSEWRWPASDLHPTHTLMPEFDPKSGIAPEEEWRFRFERSGEWGFHDHLAPYMTGKIIVSETRSESSRIEDFRLSDDRAQIETLRMLGKKEGPRAVLTFLKEAYPDEPSDKHELVHIVGEAAFLKSGFKGFDACDSFLRFGCYHGVILEAIRKNGYSEKVMDNLAQGCLALPKNKTVITACSHGIGHGIMWVRSYDLLASYKECERIFSDDQDRFFCYDGVSMENVVRRDTRPGLANNLESPDPYYPCSVVPVKYQPACAREHIFYARRTFFEKDTLKTAGYCLYFKEEETRKECFGALGNALNQDFFDSPQRIVEECGKIEEAYRHFCFNVAASQYAFGGRLDNARLICTAIGDPEKEMACKGAAEAAVASLF